MWSAHYATHPTIEYLCDSSKTCDASAKCLPFTIELVSVFGVYQSFDSLNRLFTQFMLLSSMVCFGFYWNSAYKTHWMQHTHTHTDIVNKFVCTFAFAGNWRYFSAFHAFILNLYRMNINEQMALIQIAKEKNTRTHKVLTVHTTKSETINKIHWMRS